jgi:hypothetical protein|uniref:Uncharacterized protein n=1 Tax=viral metagenome TaxID=1070528 RepID=A0A6C0J038_9ZZZZ
MDICVQREIGDRMAIPFFALLIYYFINKRDARTDFENLLLSFCIVAFLADSYWLLKI